jgi:peroxiredoxin
VIAAASSQLFLGMGSSSIVILPTARLSTLLLAAACLFLSSCSGGSASLKTIFAPPTVTVDTTGPHYLHHVSEIKYWDRINAANRATNFAWTDSAGTVHEMYEYYDKVVVLTFFGTWSQAALTQLSTIDSIRALGDTNILYLAVAMREGVTAGRAVVRIDSFADAHKITYPLLIGSRDFGFTYGGIDVVPTTFVITRRRKIAATYEGLVTPSALLDAIAKAEEKP